VERGDTFVVQGHPGVLGERDFDLLEGPEPYLSLFKPNEGGGESIKRLKKGKKMGW